MSKVNNFDVLKTMSLEDKEIGLCNQFVSAQTAKGGGHVTMGVPQDLVVKLALQPDKYQVCLLFYNI